MIIYFKLLVTTKLANRIIKNYFSQRKFVKIFHSVVIKVIINEFPEFIIASSAFCVLVFAY